MDRIDIDEEDKLWASRQVRIFSSLVVDAIRKKAEEK